MEKELKTEWSNNLEHKMKLDKRFTHWYESPANIKHLTVKNILQNQKNQENVNLLDEENATSVQSPENSIPVGVDQEVPNYEEENKTLRNHCVRGVMESVNPKLSPSHSNIEPTRTHNVFSSLPELSTEGVAL